MNEDESQAVCPYCGHAPIGGPRCDVCHGLFEPLSRQATQNAMGPWFIRDESQPFRPGCSYETLARLIERGKVTTETIVRGPMTHQFWKRVGQVQGLSHLAGVCYECGERVGRTDVCCEYCGVLFTVEGDRDTLGLAPVRSIEAMTVAKAAAPPARVNDPLASVGYDRLRAAVDAASLAESGDAARSALAEATDDSPGAVAVPRQPHRRRIRKEQLTPGQLLVEQARREQRMFMVKGAIGAVIVFIAALGLIWMLAWAGAISLPFPLPGVHPGGKAITPPAAGQPPESGVDSETTGDDEANASPEVAPDNPTLPVETAAIDPARQALLDLYAEGVRLVDGTTIENLEEAVADFIKVRDELPENLHPEDLPAQLRKAQRRLEQLKLDQPPDG